PRARRREPRAGAIPAGSPPARGPRAPSRRSSGPALALAPRLERGLGHLAEWAPESLGRGTHRLELRSRPLPHARYVRHLDHDPAESRLHIEGPALELVALVPAQPDAERARL